MLRDQTVRKIDEDLWRRLKAQAAMEGRTVAECISEAISLWLAGRDKRGGHHV